MAQLAKRKSAYTSGELGTLSMYRGVNKGLYVLLSRTQSGPGRTVKQEQEEISRNHVHTFIYLSVDLRQQGLHNSTLNKKHINIVP